jgi:hypothetical protein
MQKIFKKLFVLMCGCIMATFVLTACEKEVHNNTANKTVYRRIIQ